MSIHLLKCINPKDSDPFFDEDHVSNNSYYDLRVMDQFRKKPPIASRSHIVLGESYQNYNYYVRKLEDNSIPELEFNAKYKKGALLSTASFNLTMTSLSHNDTIDLINEFDLEYNVVCSVVDQVYDKGEASDSLLVCYPEAVSKAKKPLPAQDNATKDKFYGFLLHKRLMTEKDVYDTNIWVGSHHVKIIEEKSRLDAIRP